MLEFRKGRIEQCRAFFQAAYALAPQMYEPHYNSAMMSELVSGIHVESSLVLSRIIEMKLIRFILLPVRFGQLILDCHHFMHYFM